MHVSIVETAQIIIASNFLRINSTNRSKSKHKVCLVCILCAMVSAHINTSFPSSEIQAMHTAQEYHLFVSLLRTNWNWQATSGIDGKGHIFKNKMLILYTVTSFLIRNIVMHTLGIDFPAGDILLRNRIIVYAICILAQMKFI